MYLPLNQLDGASRVWVYNTKEFLSPEQIKEVLEHTAEFLKQWTAHQKDLYAGCGFAFFRHLIIAVDESQAPASGCSIDSCVHFLQNLGDDIGVDFFDRLHYTFVLDETPYKVHHNDLDTAFAERQINEQTLFVDPTVKNLEAFHTKFTKPLKDSFQYRFITANQAL